MSSEINGVSLNRGHHLGLIVSPSVLVLVPTPLVLSYRHSGLPSAIGVIYEVPLTTVLKAVSYRVGI